jgi:hypothetical protein
MTSNSSSRVDTLAGKVRGVEKRAAVMNEPAHPLDGEFLWMALSLLSGWGDLGSGLDFCGFAYAIDPPQLRLGPIPAWLH